MATPVIWLWMPGSTLSSEERNAAALVNPPMITCADGCTVVMAARAPVYSLA